MREDILSFMNVAPDAPFRMHLAGTSYCDGSYRIVRRNADCYVFEYVVQGSGYLRIDGEEVQPEGGDVYLVPYGSNHEYGSSSRSPWIKHWFNVSGSLVDNLLAAYKISNIHLYKNCPLTDIFTAGLKALRDKPEDASGITGQKIIFDIIAALAQHVSGKENSNISASGEKLRKYLESKIFSPPLSLREMCLVVNRSPAQTIRIFKNDFDKTPYQYLLDMKIETAKKLLVNSVRPVKEIAFELGFADEYYFSNIFKKKTRLAPAIYRHAASAEQ